MVKLSRAAFLYSLGAAGVFILTGCGSGTDKNSSFGGSYRSAYTIPAKNENGTFTFTVDVKGKVSGVFDNQGGQIREFNGEIDNNTSLSGATLIRASGLTGTLDGNASGPGAPGVPETLVPITGGNFVLVEQGTTYAGSFVVDSQDARNPFQAAYTDAGRFADAFTIENAPPSTITSSPVTEFSVDGDGRLIGKFGTHSVVAQITNNGNITGTITGEGERQYGFRGIVNSVTWQFGQESDPPSLPGLKADLVFTIDGREYTGYIKTTGGDGTN
jgi:hypothetical protein